MTPEEFGALVVRYRRFIGGSVTSWGRSYHHNQAVGGVPHSPHLEDRGADVRNEGGLSAESRTAYAHSLGLQLIVEKDHDHLQPLDWTPREG